VTRSYRLGVQVVFITVLLSASLALAMVSREPSVAPRAGQDLPRGAFPVGEFQLVERSGRTVTQADVADRVWIAAFIFTRCPLSCPRISSVMRGIQARLTRTDVLLVSISVDPDHDSPAVLSSYAAQFGASPDRWWFLTGTRSSIHDLVVNRFKLSLAETTPADRATGGEAISHSDRLALVDRGQIVGLFESNDQPASDALVARARRLALPRWVKVLPTLNASFNALCTALLLAGWWLIRRFRVINVPPAPGASESTGPASLTVRPIVRAHATCMLLAVAASTLFLISYLVYHGQAGSMSFRHGGAVRIVYFSILLSHTILASLGVVPLVLLTLFRAVRRDFAKHARVAQITFPIWLYVSITGVVIYLMLYGPAFLEGSGYRQV
jgi:protein SCO1/2/putative membrane protein